MSRSRMDQSSSRSQANLSGTSLQLPSSARHSLSPATELPDPSPSPSRSTNTRQTRTSTNTNQTSMSALSANSSSIKLSLYPTSGYPVSSSVLTQSYPGTGHPVAHLEHSYGYPSSNFPCCAIPGLNDLRSQLTYPSSEFPGGGTFPGEIEQDDGFHPFIGGFSSSGTFSTDPLALANPSAGFGSNSSSLIGPQETLPMPGSFDPYSDSAGYPM